MVDSQEQGQWQTMAHARLLAPHVTVIALFVEVSRARAAQFGNPLDKVYAALRAQNVINPVCNVRAGPLRLQIHPQATVESVQTLKSLVVAGDATIGLTDFFFMAVPNGADTATALSPPPDHPACR